MVTTWKVIEWRVAGGDWSHGRTIESWVDGDTLRYQRRFVCEVVRATENIPPGARIQTRVRSVEEAS